LKSQNGLTRYREFRNERCRNATWSREVGVVVVGEVEVEVEVGVEVEVEVGVGVVVVVVVEVGVGVGVVGEVVGEVGVGVEVGVVMRNEWQCTHGVGHPTNGTDVHGCCKDECCVYYEELGDELAYELKGHRETGTNVPKSDDLAHKTPETDDNRQDDAVLGDSYTHYPEVGYVLVAPEKSEDVTEKRGCSHKTDLPKDWQNEIRAELLLMAISYHEFFLPTDVLVNMLGDADNAVKRIERLFGESDG
jgi:hypothetical protein